MNSQLQRHPLSAAFGDMPPDEFAELKDSIRETGLTDPVIVLFEGKVLDGWHRYRAVCELEQAGQIVPGQATVEPLRDGVDPVAFVWSRNGLRRHLTPSQRAGLMARLRSECLKLDTEQEPHQSIRSMAGQAGVSVQTMADAVRAEEAGHGDEVIAGEVSASSAARSVDALGDGDFSPPPEDSPTIPKPKSRKERDQARIEALEIELQVLRSENEEKDTRIRLCEDEHEAIDAGRLRTHNNQLERIRVLEGTVYRLQQEKADADHRAAWFGKQAV